MPKIRTGITCRKLFQNVVAVTSLFTAFGKQPRFFTLGENQCWIHTMQATN